jgi:hypothetical protein
MKWMFCELSEKLRLEGGVEFLDSLPVSTVSHARNVFERPS